MLTTISHRGKDSSKTISLSEECVLGANRLAIFDLNERGDQPLMDSSGRYTIVYNGEVYNYRELKEDLKYDFETKTDTEVVLAAYKEWGEKCLDRLNGMFSFVIYDNRENNLFISRDRFGIKPFYFCWVGDTFVFASEIKAILEFVDSYRFNKKVFANYFLYGSYGGLSESFYNGIKQLPAGHYAKVADGECSLNKWYNFKSKILELEKWTHELDFEEAKSKFLKILQNSIRLRLRSDVELGINLSGGIDSSILINQMINYFPSRQLTAYTYTTNDKRYDELNWARNITRDYPQVRHSEVQFTPQDFKEFNNYISYVQDEPHGGLPTLAYSKIFKKSNKSNVAVLLDGNGSDEILAGYNYYRENSDNLIQGMPSDHDPYNTIVISAELSEFGEKPDYPKPFKSDLRNLQYRDLFYTKIPRVLRFNDRASMAFTTELRSPFLDHNLVEFGFSLPREYKINEGQGKYLLRDILKYSNGKNALAPKRPLQTPQREWLANELAEEVEKSIEKIRTSEYNNWFDIKEMEEAWDDYKKGKNHSSFHIWQWVSFSMLI